MGIIFGLCCLLISPIVLFTYGVIKHLNALHVLGAQTKQPKNPVRNQGGLELVRQGNDHS